MKTNTQTEYKITEYETKEDAINGDNGSFDFYKTLKQAKDSIKNNNLFYNIEKVVRKWDITNGDEELIYENDNEDRIVYRNYNQ